MPESAATEVRQNDLLFMLLPVKVARLFGECAKGPFFWVREARFKAGWSLCFAAIVYIEAPQQPALFQGFMIFECSTRMQYDMVVEKLNITALEIHVDDELVAVAKAIEFVHRSHLAITQSR